MTNSMSSSYSVNSIDDDLKYLLFLETVKRMKDDEMNITKQVDEKSRECTAAKSEYLKAYTKYVDIVTKAATRAVLDKAKYLEDCPIEKASENIESIKSKTTKHTITECVQPQLLAEFKANLTKCNAHTKLHQLHTDMVELKTNMKAIQTSMENVENTLETVTLQGLDFFVDEVAAEAGECRSP